MVASLDDLAVVITNTGLVVEEKDTVKAISYALMKSVEVDVQSDAALGNRQKSDLTIIKITEYDGAVTIVQLEFRGPYFGILSILHHAVRRMSSP